MFLTPKLITCFIDKFNFKMTSQSIAYLLNGSIPIYWILDLGDEMHSMWDSYITDLQEYKDNRTMIFS